MTKFNFITAEAAGKISGQIKEAEGKSSDWRDVRRVLRGDAYSHYDFCHVRAGGSIGGKFFSLGFPTDYDGPFLAVEEGTCKIYKFTFKPEAEIDPDVFDSDLSNYTCIDTGKYGTYATQEG